MRALLELDQKQWSAAGNKRGAGRVVLAGGIVCVTGIRNRLSVISARFISGRLVGVNARDSLTVLSFVALLGPAEFAADYVRARRAERSIP